VDDEITGLDSSKGGKGGIPTQRIEMETRMLVDYAGELALCRTGIGPSSPHLILRRLMCSDKLVSGSG
jgi:hypothetical protein